MLYFEVFSNKLDGNFRISEHAKKKKVTAQRVVRPPENRKRTIKSYANTSYVRIS